MRVASVLFTTLTLGLAPALYSQGASSYVVDNVTVVDVVAGALVPGQRVVISGTRIASVGPVTSVTSPPNAVIVDGQGKFLIPGLWDMHVHIGAGAGAGRAFGLFLANGVTGVRDMGSGVDDLLTLRAAVTSGKTFGPRIVGAGVLVDGAPIVYEGITWLATTPEQARKAVDSLAARGVNFIKAYEMLRPEVYLALAEQAKSKGLPFAGHLPLMVSAEDAVRAGHKSFEHLRGLEIACSSKADSLRAVATQRIEVGKDQPGMQVRGNTHAALRQRAYDTYDEAKCGALIRLMAHAGAWQTPNLVLQTQLAYRPDTTDFFQRWVPYAPEGMRSLLSSPRIVTPPPGTSATGLAQLISRPTEGMMRATRMLHEGGVRVLPGSDYPNPIMIPGVSLHEELALLVRAGLTTAEALRAGTLNPAIYLGATDSLGTIAPGKLADVVLLDADPLANIRNVAQVRAVWRNGRYLSRTSIDLMLEGMAKRGR